ncbi:MAG: YiiX/YebB-like N1pC/P60 family cysteine hydrolase [Bacteriovorax sp.]|nr:YiiX/YebB-like N1pC/P60 family cysteine hydrolase [Bacteriovorax sp.]
MLFTLIAFLGLNFSHAFDLKAGDVLLISFNCYECRVIESETNSKFSHSGVIIKNELNEIFVGQSLGHVALYPLDQFLKNKTPGTIVSIYRPKEFLNLQNAERTALEERMLSTFNSIFKDAPFDTKYLWNNFDEHGRELLYCSEFIAKFLDHFLESPTIPYSLTYKKNEAYWFKYFQGVIPEGELGNSPASFSHDSRFIFVGSI